MLLNDILKAVQKVDGRRKLGDSVTKYKASLQRIKSDGYVITLSTLFKQNSMNKVVSMTMDKLKRLGVTQFHEAAASDKPVTEKNLLMTCEKFVCDEFTMHIFFTVKF